MVRAFIAIDLTDNIKNRIYDTVLELKDYKNIRIVSKELLHITLHFLGEINEEKIKKVEEIMSNIKFNIFSVSLEGIGFFEPKRPRVVFINVNEGKNEIKEIYKLLYKPIERTGINLDKREFIPHLTIARLKGIRNSKKLIEFAKKHDEKFGGFKCNMVLLKRSDFIKNGVKHTTLYSKLLEEPD